jgi:glycosyltransferase involved in cell wall biosynthesis
MRLSITSDYLFARTPDGKVWSDGPCHIAHWSRYLQSFASVNVIARVREIESPSDRMQRADGDRVSFTDLPAFSGIWNSLWQSSRIHRAMKAAIHPQDAVILHIPGRIAAYVATTLERERPYGVQVVGDPYDALAPGVVRHPLRPMLRWWCTRQVKQLAASATAAIYVTERTLQQRYPSHGRMFGVSDVDLTPDAFREPTPASSRQSRRTIVSVGTMTQLYKGFDVLINAVALLAKSEMVVQLVLVGDGRYRPLLEEQVRRLGLESQVAFRGQLPAGPRIRSELDAVDLFVLPSRTEGLSRALVEAMARSLPCIATRVGGTPELLSDSDLVPAGDVNQLANAIHRTLESPERMREMAARNFAKAREFHIERLDPLRQEYFEYLANRTRKWCRAADTVLRVTAAANAPKQEASP